MKFLLVSVFIVSCKALNIPYRSCTYNGQEPTGKVTSINIDPLPAGGCDHVNPRSPFKLCYFDSQGHYNGTITFHAGESSTTATTRVRGLIGGSLEPFSVEPDACGNGITCPVTAGNDVTYRATVQVPQNKAGIVGVGQWQLIGDNNKAILCFLIPFQIK